MFKSSSPRFGNAVKHFVAKLGKSFGGLGDATESLDDFRYSITWSKAPNGKWPLSINYFWMQYSLVQLRSNT